MDWWKIPPRVGPEKWVTVFYDPFLKVKKSLDLASFLSKRDPGSHKPQGGPQGRFFTHTLQPRAHNLCHQLRFQFLQALPPLTLPLTAGGTADVRAQHLARAFWKA